MVSQPFPIPLPVQRLSIFSILGARASKKVEHWRAWLCGKQRKSTASGQGEGLRKKTGIRKNSYGGKSVSRDRSRGAGANRMAGPLLRRGRFDPADRRRIC